MDLISKQCKVNAAQKINKELQKKKYRITILEVLSTKTVEFHKSPWEKHKEENEALKTRQNTRVTNTKLQESRLLNKQGILKNSCNKSIKKCTYRRDK